MGAIILVTLVYDSLNFLSTFEQIVCEDGIYGYINMQKIGKMYFSIYEIRLSLKFLHYYFNIT